MKAKKTISVAAAILAMALALPAAAVTVTYTVGGLGPIHFPASTLPPPSAPWGTEGYPGDTLEFQTHTGTLDLVPGTQVLKINTLLWTIDYTYGGTADDPSDWSELAFGVEAPRSIVVHTSNGALAQTGLLEAAWEDDYLSFAAGSSVSFLVEGEAGVFYSVRVTPLALARVGAFSGWPNKCAFPCSLVGRDMMATFVVDLAVPAGTTAWGCVKALYR